MDSDSARAKHKQVLVVDDNRDAADTLAMLLEAEGCECHIAYSGAEALAAAERDRPDVVILDLFMPHMSGDEVARALRRRPGGDEMTLIAHTAMSSYLHHQEIMDAGFDHHLVKPAPLDELIALVSEDDDAPHPYAARGRPPSPAAAPSRHW
jgi:CheY-like chemotaxis protein